MEIIDISKGLLETPVYPGDPEPVLQRVMDMSYGDPLNLSQLSAGVHAGTHADSPLHFITDGDAIDTVSLNHFFGKCLLGDDVVNIPECNIFLLKGDQPISENDAQNILDKKIITIGVETMSIGDFETHRILLSNGVIIIENLELSEVDCGEYILSAFPIKIEGSEGAYVRAVLIKNFA